MRFDIPFQKLSTESESVRSQNRQAGNWKQKKVNTFLYSPSLKP